MNFNFYWNGMFVEITRWNDENVNTAEKCNTYSSHHIASHHINLINYCAEWISRATVHRFTWTILRSHCITIIFLLRNSTYVIIIKCLWFETIILEADITKFYLHLYLAFWVVRERYKYMFIELQKQTQKNTKNIIINNNKKSL